MSVNLKELIEIKKKYTDNQKVLEKVLRLSELSVKRLTEANDNLKKYLSVAGDEDIVKVINDLNELIKKTNQEITLTNKKIVDLGRQIQDLRCLYVNNDIPED